MARPTQSISLPFGAARISGCRRRRYWFANSAGHCLWRARPSAHRGAAGAPKSGRSALQAGWLARQLSILICPSSGQPSRLAAKKVRPPANVTQQSLSSGRLGGAKSSRPLRRRICCSEQTRAFETSARLGSGRARNEPRTSGRQADREEKATTIAPEKSPRKGPPQTRPVRELSRARYLSRSPAACSQPPAG